MARWRRSEGFDNPMRPGKADEILRSEKFFCVYGEAKKGEGTQQMGVVQLLKKLGVQ